MPDAQHSFDKSRSFYDVVKGMASKRLFTALFGATIGITMLDQTDASESFRAWGAIVLLGSLVSYQVMQGLVDQRWRS